MKKKLISFMLAVSLCMGMSTTVKASESAFQTEDFALPESRYSEMWVGDHIFLNMAFFDYEITEGTENVEMNLANGTLDFVQAGTTAIAVTAKDGGDLYVYYCPG